MVTAVTWQLSNVVLGTCCLSSGSGDGRVSRRPLVSGNPPVGTRQVGWGRKGTGRAPPGPVRIRSRLSLFSKLGIIVLIYGITKITS